MEAEAEGAPAKPAHSMLSNAAYSIALLWRADRPLVFFAALGTLTRVALPFAGILAPRIVIDEITAQASPARFAAVMAAMAGALAALNFAHGYAGVKIDWFTGTTAQAEWWLLQARKLTTMDLASREHPRFNRVHGRAWRSGSDQAPAAAFARTLSALATNLGGLLLYGSVVALAHPLMLAPLALGALATGLLQRRHRKFDEARRGAVGRENRKRRHISLSLGDRAYAKDIRMFSMAGWLLERHALHTGEVRKSDAKSARRGLAAGIADSLAVLARDGGAYAFLTYLLLSGGIGLGEFVMLFAATGGMAGWVGGALSESTALLRCSVEVSDRRESLDFPDAPLEGPGRKPPRAAPEIRLENVSFSYPGAKKPALKNVSLAIRPGERLAVVGANGAGKTTLVKLVCGFYRPSGGRVLCDGASVAEHAREDYFDMIAAVFQDIHLMPASISENVSLRPPEATDAGRVRECLELAGLWGKVRSLEKGAGTNLVRQVHDDAVELSGGERQKLALARALYKDAPLLVLDEPTAALDPIAENETYRRYADLTRGKTSIYISHRLASTRFCDRIILIDGEGVAEAGTHDELMALGGKYAGMFEIQASYYAERGAAT